MPQMEKTISRKLTNALGDVAGAVVDPKMGWQKLKMSVAKPMSLLTGAAIVAAFIAGRRSVHD